MQDLYATLGVHPEAGSASIKVAYRNLAKQTHPDLHLGDGEAENRTKEINYAYMILSDPELRAAYDQELARLAARARRLRLVNGSAIAAGIAALLVAGAALTMTAATWLHGDPHVQSKLASRPAPNRIATVGVPESAFTDSRATDSKPSPGAGIAEAPAQAAAPAIAGNPKETPASEPSRAALAALPEAAPAAKTGVPAASQPEPSNEALAQAAADRPSPVTLAAVPEAAPEAKTGVPAATLPAPSNEAAAQAAAGKPAPAAKTEVASASLPASLNDVPAKEMQHATLAMVPQAKAEAAQKPVAEAKQRDVYAKRTLAGKEGRKSAERKRPFEYIGFAPPRLQEDTERAPWLGSRKAMATRWPSADAPLD